MAQSTPNRVIDQIAICGLVVEWNTKLKNHFFIFHRNSSHLLTKSSLASQCLYKYTYNIRLSSIEVRGTSLFSQQFRKHSGRKNFYLEILMVLLCWVKMEDFFYLKCEVFPSFGVYFHIRNIYLDGRFDGVVSVVER